MAKFSQIEWTDHTFNPWEGCQKVGPGCDHCYAETRNARFAGGTAINWGPGAPRRRTSPANWRKPLAWNAAHDKFFAQHGRRQRVFCASLADVFDNAVPIAWLADFLDLCRLTPLLDKLLLTKRIGNVKQRLAEALEYAQEVMLNPLLANWIACWLDGDWPPADLWLGITIVNQEEADRDIPKLLETPAHVRFLSMEPLLGPVDLTRLHNPDPTRASTAFIDSLRGGTWGDVPTTGERSRISHYPLDRIDWVIVGGESGPGARPMHPGWVRSLRDQCASNLVPFLFKQWGEWLPWLLFNATKIDDDFEQTRYLTTIWQDDHWEDCGYPIWCDMQDNYGGGANGPEDPDQIMGRVGKKAAGRLLDGVEHTNFPQVSHTACRRAI